MIPAKRTVNLREGQILYLVSLGDIGFGGPRFGDGHFNKDIKYWISKKKAGHKVKFIGLGDYLAATSPSERAEILQAKGGHGFYEYTLEDWDRAAIKKAEEFCEVMAPFKGDVWGLTSGHHYYSFTRESPHFGLNSDEYICKKLKADYWGVICHLTLDFPQWNKKFAGIVHHGYGSGRARGGKLTKRARVLEGFQSNFVWMGHDNSRMCDCANLLVYRNGKISFEESRIIGTGSYETAYETGKAKTGYVEQGLMNPSAIGAAVTTFEHFDGDLRIRTHI